MDDLLKKKVFDKKGDDNVLVDIDDNPNYNFKDVNRVWLEND